MGEHIPNPELSLFAHDKLRVRARAAGGNRESHRELRGVRRELRLLLGR